MPQTQVIFTRQARKGLEKAPKEIRQRLVVWIKDVEEVGLSAANAARPGLRPHPLTGQLQGLWAIRLSLQWRVIYDVSADQIIITLLEVTPHDYRTR